MRSLTFFNRLRILCFQNIFNDKLTLWQLSLEKNYFKFKKRDEAEIPYSMRRSLFYYYFFFLILFSSVFVEPAMFHPNLYIPNCCNHKIFFVCIWLVSFKLSWPVHKRPQSSRACMITYRHRIEHFVQCTYIFNFHIKIEMNNFRRH